LLIKLSVVIKVSKLEAAMGCFVDKLVDDDDVDVDDVAAFVMVADLGISLFDVDPVRVPVVLYLFQALPSMSPPIMPSTLNKEG
jgi:hypothetical protein